MAGRGRWRRARWERQWRRRRRCVGGERQSGNINFLTQVVAGGGEGEHLKTKKRGVEKCGKDEEKGEWWWLKRKVPIGKVRRAQRGLGPRLRVARRAVGAKARFRAQRAIPRYTDFPDVVPAHPLDILPCIAPKPVTLCSLMCSWPYTTHCFTEFRPRCTDGEATELWLAPWGHFTHAHTLEHSTFCREHVCPTHFPYGGNRLAK
jgi:hypothetical protein